MVPAGSNKARGPVQHQDIRKNYIRIVNDASEHDRAAGTAMQELSTVKGLVGRLAAALKRRLHDAPRPPTAS